MADWREWFWFGALALGCAGCKAAPDEAEATVAARDDRGARARCDWAQWGGDPAHTGAACEGPARFDRIAAHLTFDPFVEEEKDDAAIFAGTRALLTHYQTPLLVGDDVYLETKAGEYTACAEVGPDEPCGPFAWNSQVWTEQRFHWRGHQLVHDWTFASDWKPPVALIEPVFHAAVAGRYVYVPGASGSVHKLDRKTGRELATIALPEAASNPRSFVAGGLAADAHGNVYYNAFALDPLNEFGAPRAAWLVKVRPDDTVQTAAFASIAVGAPAATDPCVNQFFGVPLPLPPAPDAVPPSFPCGPQRPGFNITPAIGDDGTVVTVSTAHFNPRYSYVIAVNADLSPKWTTSLRDFLDDGCGVTTPIDAPPGTTDPVLRRHCRIGTTPGVDRTTNQRPAGMVRDTSSSSPVILPDGGVLYGAFTDYNGSRGHTFKFDRDGHKVASYDFGWDITPAVYRHDGTYSIVIKDNQYAAEQFYMTQLDADLRPEWSFLATNNQRCQRGADGAVTCADDPEHPRGFEWCVNAPAVDRDGNVYANSEDGWVYKIGQGGVQRDRMFLLEALGAAYTPISLDREGRLFTLNGGDLFVITDGHGHDDDRDHDDGDD